MYTYSVQNINNPFKDDQFSNSSEVSPDCLKIDDLFLKKTVLIWVTVDTHLVYNHYTKVEKSV